jgi:PKD repeat protein
VAKLASTDLALVTARLGCLRLGASRLGFYPFDVNGPGTAYPCEYMWREVKPPTTQWSLVYEGIVCGKRPVAAFSDLPDSSETGQDVQFTDLSTPSGEITYWHWDFGDGEESYEQNPVHAYSAIGIYTVTLSVASAKGSDTATGTHECADPL